MGVCGYREINTKDHSHAFDVMPPDTEALKSVALPILSFYVLLSDIKIKKCSYDFVSLKLIIEGIQQKQLPLREIDRNQKAYWKINYAFDFKMTEYQLRRKFAVLEIRDKHGQLQGNLKLNLYTIWVGPYHLDFKLALSNSKLCRLSLNFKISQGIHLRIETLSTRLLRTQKPYLQDRFTFSVEAIIGQQLDPSSFAYHLCVKESGMSSPRKEIIETHCVDPSDIAWTKELGKQLPLPKFDKKIPYYEIYSSSLHITFWKVVPSLDQESKFRYLIESECFVSLTKFMGLDYSIKRDPNTNISYMEHTVDLQEKTWLHGKQTGRAVTKFHFSMQVHERQMQACVRTEEGILTSSPVFHDKGAGECEELAGLKYLHTETQKEFINLDQNGNHKGSYIAEQECILRICNLMNLQLALLQKTSKESIQFYEYKNQLQLYKGQRFMIDLAFKMMAYAREEKPQIQQISWTILTTILRRGEFKLSHLGFSKTDKESIQAHKIGEVLKLKIEVGLKYQELLSHLLQETFRSLQFKGDEQERHFAESFCSYAYFRIPLFREHILAAVRREGDPQILQWRGTEFNLNQQNSSSTSLGHPDDFYQHLFDWEGNFYQCLLGEETYRENYAHLQQVLSEDRWKDRVSRRGGAFFTFLENLVQEIEYVSVVSKYIKWQALPGYSRLLHAFLVELKVLRIRNYNDRLRACCVRLLANQKLLNILVVILLKKTNVHQTETIFGTFDLVDQFFKSLCKNRRSIPSTFDYKFLLQGIRMVLDSELQYSISQVLLLFFNHFNIFSQEFALQLALYLLSRHFFRFFFHWSFNLRHVFHVLMLTRISIFEQKRTQNNHSQAQNTYIIGLRLAVSQRYDQVMQVIKQEIEPKATQFNLDHFHEKELFKKMRFKVRSKMHEHEHVSSKNSIPQLVIPKSLRSTRSLGNTPDPSTPRKLLYLLEEDIELIPMKPTSMCYVKQSLTEFTTLKEQLAEKFTLDPDFTPDMQIKRVLDEKQFKPITVDEW